MQKQLGKIGEVSRRSTKRVTPKKVAAKKPSLSKTAPQKRTAKKLAPVAGRIRVNRLSSPLIPWENQTNVRHAVSAPAPEAVATATDQTRITDSSTPHMPWHNRATALNTTDLTTLHTLMIPAQDIKSMAPPQPLILRENQTYARRSTDVIMPQAFPATSTTLWKQALRASLHIPSRLLSLFDWYTNQKPIPQKRIALQMLIVSGSVRPCNIEFRYSTAPEESGSLSRSFAVTPPSDIHPSTPLQMFLARSQAGGAQLIQRIRMQECYARLYSRSIQLVEWLRRELSTRTYLSRT